MKRLRTLCIACLVAAISTVAAGSEPALPDMAWASVNHTSLRYQLAGNGQRRLVLLHEMGMSLESWDYLYGPLSRRYRVLRYDLRGFGLSEKLNGAVTIEQEVEDLRELLDSLGIVQPVTLMGGAVGGAIALRFAALYPARAEAVMAISPAAGVPPQNRAASMASAAATERSGIHAYVDSSFNDIYPAAIQRDHADRVAKFRALQYANDAASVAATLRMIAITEWDSTWATIKCPAWIVAAALYPQRSIASQQAMASQMPQGRFAALNTGHFMATQSPELLQPLLEQFLAATAR